VLVEWLGAGTAWRHEIGAAGARSDIRLADGRRLRTGEVGAVLNRMLAPPAAATAAAVPGDADYARNELTSFAASWIRTLAPRVLNQPTPQGLCGRWRPPLHWRALAVEAGLPVAPLAVDSREGTPAFPRPGDEASLTVLAIGGEPLTDGMPPEVRDGARRLAALADTPILGLRFAGGDPAGDGWRLLDATPYPDLSAAGERGVEALAAQLAA
jgi:hypothetical protein